MFTLAASDQTTTACTTSYLRLYWFLVRIWPVRVPTQCLTGFDIAARKIPKQNILDDFVLICIRIVDAYCIASTTEQLRPRKGNGIGRRPQTVQIVGRVFHRRVGFHTHKILCIESVSCKEKSDCVGLDHRPEPRSNAAGTTFVESIVPSQDRKMQWCFRFVLG